MSRAALWLLLMLPLLAQAHTRSLSQSVWLLDAEPVSLALRLDSLDLTRLQLHPDWTRDYDSAVLAHVQSHLRLRRDGQDCDYLPAPAQRLRPLQGQLQLHLQLDCPAGAARWQISQQLFADVLAGHQHLASVHYNGQRFERLLSSADDGWLIEAQSADSDPMFGDFVALGISHILSGWDHLAFVLGLLLLARSLTQLAWLVSGFTLGHSLSLAAATFGLVAADTRLVEALIGLSILLLAFELAWRAPYPRALPIALCAGLLLLAGLSDATAALVLFGMALFCLSYLLLIAHSQQPGRWRLGLSLAFGLIHGFGFAGLLAQLPIASSQRPLALLGFNLGVELGQLAVVAAAGLLLLALRRWQALIRDLASAGLAGLGSYWLIVRLLV